MFESTCACGCGGQASTGKKFISGHNARGAQRKRRIAKTCACCGQHFSGTEAAIGSRTYCSKKCRDDHRRRSIGEANPSFKRVDTTCANCGVPLKVAPNKLARRPDQYCSPACGREGQRRKLRGVEKPCSHWRTSALRAYGEACAVCGFANVVEVHHIVPRHRGGTDEIDNLCPLCPNHHAMAHAGLLAPEAILAARCKAVLS